MALVLAGSIAQAEIDVSGAPGFESGGSGRGIHVPAPREEIEFDPGDVSGSKGGDLLVFRNGDRLGGELAGIDQARGIAWKHAESASPVTFSLAANSISRVGLSGNREASAYAYVVRLTNGDVLPASAVAFRDGRLTAMTEYAGTLTVGRKHVAQVDPVHSAGLIYSGPASLRGWSASGPPDTWRYREDEFVSSQRGVLAREFDLPEAGSVEFEVSWKGSLQLAVSILGAQLQNYGSGGYTLRFLGNRAELYRYSQVIRQHSRSTTRNSLGSLPDLAFGESGAARIGISFDTGRGTIGLSIDGRLAKEWKDDDGKLAREGDVLLFNSQGGFPIRMCKIRVAAWNGTYPVPAEEPLAEDVVRLANGDAVSGAIVRIDETNAVVRTRYADLEIPLGRVASAAFARGTEEAAPSGSRSVVAELQDGGSLALELREMDDETLKGTSSLFGDIEIRVGAIRSLQWAPQNEDTDTL